MRIGTFETHPAADIPPEMDAEEFEALCESIKTRGLVDDIVYILVGKKQLILDGRHRLRACLKVGVKPRFTRYTGDDPVGFVESRITRRNLTASQIAVCINEFAKLQNGQRKVGKFAELKTQAEVAKARGISDRYMRYARVVEDAPAVKQAIRQGKLAVDAGAELVKLPKDEQRKILARVTKGKGEAKTGHVRALIRQAKKREVAARIESERLPMPLGPFRCIVTDFPWKFQNSDGHAGSRGHTPYPPMTEDEILAMAPTFAELAHEDCVWWCWTTNAHLVDGTAPRVVSAFGFRAITLLTWEKNKPGMGSWLFNKTEHAILAIRGNPTVTLTNETTILRGDVREHSRKPEAFYELVEKLCPGDKLELFAQTPREGWARWGAESEKYAVAS